MPPESTPPGSAAMDSHSEETTSAPSSLMLGPGKRYWKDWTIQRLLLLAALSSVAVTTGIVAILVYESAPFFKKVPLSSFLTDTMWSPTFPVNPHFGILPLIAGTV